MKKTKKSTQVPSGFYHKGIIKRNDLFREYPRLAFLRDIYTAMMDEVVTDVASKESNISIRNDFAQTIFL